MQSSRGVVSTGCLKRAMGRHNPEFAGDGEHESTDLCICILDAIHKDLNQSLVVKGRRVDLKSLSGVQLHQICNKSKVVDLFHGETMTEFRFQCGIRQQVRELLVFLTLSLPQGSCYRPTIAFTPGSGSSC
jgi:ubiquitin C-terminal hydrolase